MKSEVVQDAAGILAKLDWRSDVIGIDEPISWAANLIEVATRLADSGKQVILSGLDTDYMGRPFPPIRSLLCLAETITKTLAICVRCGNPAKHTQRLVASEELIVVGAAGVLRGAVPALLRSGSIEAGEAGFRASSTARRTGTAGRHLSARMQ